MVAPLQRELEDEIEGEVRFDRVSRALYATDASVYQIEPAGVVIVRSRQDVVRTVRIAGRHGCSMTARGGGTSQAGQAIGRGLQIDTSKYFNRVLEVNAAERWARVEPGVVLDELNAQLRPHGLRFAPDVSTASRATIGGMIANNSSGARSVLYGKTIDHVLELHVVLADGQVAHFRPLNAAELAAACSGGSLEAGCYRTVRQVAIDCADEINRRFPKVLRRVGGYNLDEFVGPANGFNLAKLIVGSEGTLGLIVEARIALVPMPRAKAVLTIEFGDLFEALAATPMILRHRPSAVEVMDRFILDHARERPALDALRRSVLHTDPAALLCVELYAERAEDLPPRLGALEDALAHSGVRCHCRRALTGDEQGRIWSLREAALGLSMAMKGDAKSLSFVEDTAVAPDKLRDYIERFLGIVSRHGTVAGVYAHASVGCLHVRPVVNLKTADGVRRFEAIANDVADLVLEFGGALSGEHGDGLVRGPFTEKMFGQALYQAFRTIKSAFDADGLFNPGKIVDSPPLTANLRLGTGYRTVKHSSWFDFTEYGGVAGAIEMCSGVGACRKTLAGTMCPSYMATRDESATTRGRANALRLALSGQLEESGLGDEGVYETLDLCLECRACKAECPVNVDVARLKSEFLADYWKRHGTPLRARALGGVDRLSVWGSRFAPLFNWLTASAPIRGLNEKLLGIDRRRHLPAWKRETFERWRMQRTEPRASASGPAVTLFNDTFTNHYDPEIGIAALEVLERGGCQVNVVRPGCCGRPLISQGLLAEAREYAAKLVEALFPIANRGEKILFCEPSCLSSVKEDAPSLLRGEQQKKARAVAQASLLFEDFAAQLDLPLRAGPQKILLHGHCHQKSMGLLQSSMALLSRIPSATVVDLDAGCCGMAGSFGYSKQHYDVSKTIASRRLLPAVKAMKSGDVLVAPGTSCRHQVADLAGATALHPAVLIRSLID